MYCPSCDKSYGAVHSRCPECHSWLKVSAPANSRAKNAKAASSVSAGSISTLDKEPAAPASWTEPPASGGGDWNKGLSDSWSDALPAPTAPSFPIDPAPVSDAWGGGGGAAWGGTSSSDSWGATEPAPAKTPTPTAAPIDASLTLAPSPVAPALGGGAWLSGGGEDDDGWGGSGSSGSFKAPAAPATNGLSSSDDGWGGSSSLGAATPVAAKTPASAITPDIDGDGWGGSSSSSSTFGGSKNGASKGLPAPSQGWLGGDAAAAVEDESATGWLGDSRTTKVGAAAVESDGWLGGEDTAKAKGPSMTEMVDRAIGVEEAGRLRRRQLGRRGGRQRRVRRSGVARICSAHSGSRRRLPEDVAGCRSGAFHRRRCHVYGSREEDS
jgi:hypothetical protein